MGQIAGKHDFISRVNLKDLGTVPTPAAGEHILVSSDNSMNAEGQGNFDCYIVGDGTTAANKLKAFYINDSLYVDVEYRNFPNICHYLNADSTSDTFGQEVSINDRDCCVSDFIPVEKGESVFFKAITGSRTQGVVNCAGYIFYDSNKTPISGVPTVTKTSWSYDDFIVHIPDGIAYFRTSYAYYNNSVFVIKTNIQKAVENIAITKNITLANCSIVVANENDDNYGSIVKHLPDTDFNSTDFIYVKGAKNIKYAAVFGAHNLRIRNHAGVVFYDSNKQPIHGIVTATLDHLEYNTVKLIVPDGAIYARLTVAMPYNTSIQIDYSAKDIRVVTEYELESAKKELSTVAFSHNKLVRGWFISSGYEEKCTLVHDESNNLLITLTKNADCTGCLLTINCSNLIDGESYVLHLNYSSTGHCLNLCKFNSRNKYISYGGGNINVGTDIEYKFEFTYDESYPAIGWFVNDFPVGTVFTINSCTIEKIKPIADAIEDAGKDKPTSSDDDTTKLKQLVYPNGGVLSLLHFSDIHGDASAALKIRDYYDTYSDYIDDILNTGDTVFGSNADSIGFINDANLGVALMSIGNHDTWGNTEQSFIYNKFFAPYVSSWGVTQPSDAVTNNLMYWYKDYNAPSVRLIGIDCMHPSDAQNTWLTNVLEDAKTNNLTVVMASHYMPLNSSNNAYVLYHGERPTFSALVSYGLVNSPQVMDTSFIEIVQDFIDGGGKFACWLCGHRHNDAIFYPDGYDDQLVITIDNAGAIVPDSVQTGDRTGDNMFCANVVGIDTTNKLIKLVRAGLKSDNWLRPINVLTFDYANKKVITNY